MEPTNYADTSTRQIQTVYYNGRKMVRQNLATYANNAVMLCINHMQLNHYGATSAEVFDKRWGQLHAVITRTIAGKITIVFKREVVENK